MVILKKATQKIMKSNSLSIAVIIFIGVLLWYVISRMEFAARAVAGFFGYDPEAEEQRERRAEEFQNQHGQQIFDELMDDAHLVLKGFALGRYWWPWGNYDRAINVLEGYEREWFNELEKAMKLIYPKMTIREMCFNYLSQKELDRLDHLFTT